MEDAASFINSLVGLNEQVIGIIVPMFFIYLLLFWLLVSVWVYFDARKRYENILIAVAFSVLNFFPPFNFLILIFYLVIRPEIRYDDFDDWEAGGVNVPIVNFMGKEGIEMSFELRINPKRLRDTNKSDMSLEIGWDNQDEKFKLIDKKALEEKVMEDIEEKDGESSFVNIFSKVKNKVKTQVAYIKDQNKESAESESKKVDGSNNKDSKSDEQENSESTKKASSEDNSSSTSSEENNKKEEGKTDGGELNSNESTDQNNDKNN